MVEETISDLYSEQEMRCPVHFSIGQEAVAVGVCQALGKKDSVLSGHRAHAHYLAKGGDLKRMVCELYGKAAGCAGGKGGSMHIADSTVGMLGANGIVGSSIPLACGAALKAKIMGTNQVAVSFFGDGATNQGVLHESMNLASIWKLPVIFVCENNLYAQSTPSDYSVSIENIADRAKGYSMPGEIVDGMDPLAVFDCAKNAVSRARDGDGPTVIEAKTYRYRGHYLGDNPLRYRSDSEEFDWKKIDPIPRFRVFLLEEGGATKDELDDMELAINENIVRAVEFAKKSPFPSHEELEKDVYDNYPKDQLNRAVSSME